MSDLLPLELLLDNKRNWDPDLRRWRLPSALVHSAKSVPRLFIAGDESPLGEFELKNGYIELRNPDLKISSATRVVAEVELPLRAKLSTFQQNLVLAIVAIIPATLTAFAAMGFNAAGGSSHSTAETRPIGEIIVHNRSDEDIILQSDLAWGILNLSESDQELANGRLHLFDQDENGISQGYKLSARNTRVFRVRFDDSIIKSKYANSNTHTLVFGLFLEGRSGFAGAKMLFDTTAISSTRIEFTFMNPDQINYPGNPPGITKPTNKTVNPSGG